MDRQDGDKMLFLSDLEYLYNRNFYRSCGIRVRSLDPMARPPDLFLTLGNLAQFAVILCKG